MLKTGFLGGLLGFAAGGVGPAELTVRRGVTSVVAEDMSLTLDELAKRVGATVHGEGAVTVDACAPIDTAGPHDVTFLANRKYRSFLDSTKAAAVLVDEQTTCPDHLTRLVAADPYFAFRNAMIELHGFREHPHPPAPDGGAVSAMATVHPDATIGADTIVHPHAHVEAGATVGRGCVLYPGVFVGPGAVVGDECLLYPNVVIYDGCRLGDRVTLHANTVIGQDGFGYATHEAAHHKIPQAGVVLIGDDVEMGAGCAIERSAMGATSIGRGTKIADLVSIGHGATVGEHCLLVSLVGVSGSAEIGNYVVLGGQSGIVGHLRVGHGAQIAAQSGVAGDVADGQKVGGSPAVPLGQWHRNSLVDVRKLDQRVRELEREVKRLKGEG
jgi:UDP-3-O-[3-hydroxymyristoyl] glucosamine N-acyltransferase